MKHLLVFLTVLSCIVLAACSATPTPDLEATVEAAVAATQAAQPTNTLTPEPTDTLTPEPSDTRTPMPTYTPGPGGPVAGEPWTRPPDGMAMVYVPAGEFLMGSPDGEGKNDEHPQHTVYLDGFWIDRYEVTNDQYRQCVEAGTCDAPTSCSWGLPTYGDAGKGNHPVVCVSWSDAEAYCGWTGTRLPTEAEWEKAARGTDAREYPWGNTFDGSRLNFCDSNCEYEWKDADADDGYARTAPVGSFPAGASPYGALDMAGNVWEWVADWYNDDYYSRSPRSNPQGPDSGDYRVVRGGTWFWYRLRARSADRVWTDPAPWNFRNGFRCGVSSTSSP